MPKKGENITKRKDGRYEARFVIERDSNGRIAKYGFVYAKNYLEVKRKRDLKLKNLTKDKQIKKSRQKERIPNAIMIWLDTKFSLKDSSYTNYYSIASSKIIPFFKNYTLEELDESLISQFMTFLQQEKLGTKRIRDILLVLKQFLDYYDIRIKFEIPKTFQKEIVTLTEIELAKIEKIAKETNDIKVFAILLVLFTGLRIGELCALQWKDIDFDKQVIHVRKTLIRVKNKHASNEKTRIILDTPKTQKSIRTIPINQEILSYLKNFKKEDDCYLLTGDYSYLFTKKYYEFYKNFLKEHGLEEHNFHILRHTFATRSLLCGIDVKTLSEILGHASVHTTLDLYVHVKEQEKLLQINKLTFLT